jgi:hypothetical protein
MAASPTYRLWKTFLGILMISTVHTRAFSISGRGTTRADMPKQSPGVKTVNIGKDMELSILVPPDGMNRQWSTGELTGTTITTTDGSGDVVCPSAFALAKLIAHCPFFVDDKAVLELGCGLGLPSLAALLHANPSHVALSDRDNDMLKLGYQSCTQLNRAKASVSRSTMEWADKATWPKQDFDILIGSDLLYEKSSILPLVKVLRFYLEDDDTMTKRALLVEPVSRVNRAAFTYAAFKEGLDVEEEPFPGMDDFVLLSVTCSE